MWVGEFLWNRVIGAEENVDGLIGATDVDLEALSIREEGELIMTHFPDASKETTFHHPDGFTSSGCGTCISVEEEALITITVCPSRLGILLISL